MTKFTLKTYRPSVETEKPHFYILNKGMNSGKPLKQPCPNCFILTAPTEEAKDQLYWLCFGLWRAKSFHYYLKGSVIPFITKNDLKQGILNGFEQANNDISIFKKSVKALQLLEEQEKVYKLNLKLIDDARRAVFYRYISKKMYS